MVFKIINPRIRCNDDVVYVLFLKYHMHKHGICDQMSFKLDLCLSWKKCKKFRYEEIIVRKRSLHSSQQVQGQWAQGRKFFDLLPLIQLPIFGVFYRLISIIEQELVKSSGFLPLLAACCNFRSRYSGPVMRNKWRRLKGNLASRRPDACV